MHSLFVTSFLPFAGGNAFQSSALTNLGYRRPSFSSLPISINSTEVRTRTQLSVADRPGSQHGTRITMQQSLLSRSPQQHWPNRLECDRNNLFA